MKTSKILVAAGTATMLLSCTACMKNPSNEIDAKSSHAAFTDFQLNNLVVIVRPNIAVASPALFARAIRTAPLKEVFIPQCTSTPNFERVVKLRINKNFDVKNTGRDVVSKKAGGGGSKTVPEPALNAESTTYDLKLDKTVWDTTDKIIAVKVFLKDGDMRFLDDEHSITTVETTTPTMFMCLDPIKYIEDKKDSDPDTGTDTGNPKWDEVTFYVDRTKVQTQKFNIRVIAFHKDGMHVLPLILDPAIQNDG